MSPSALSPSSLRPRESIASTRNTATPQASTSMTRQFSIRSTFLCAAWALGALATLAGCSQPGRVYATPEEATTALVAALTPINDAKVREVLGSDGVELMHSGDSAQDQATADRFVAEFNAKHQFTTPEDSVTILEVGTDDWPMPIPLVRAGDGWRFDTEVGAEEIVTRRIGRNELNAVHSLLAVVDAQREYAESGASGAPGVFADRFISDAGTHNGLFWPAAANEPQSPLGPYLADAAPEFKPPPSGQRRPFHGYYFRMLRAQGRHAPGGAMDYAVDGRLTRGFAVIAYPAEYDRSGIMTFIVSNTGVVFERDLGSSTRSKAEAITAFDPTQEWTIVPPVVE